MDQPHREAKIPDQDQNLGEFMARARIVTDHPQYADHLFKDLSSRGFEVQTSASSDSASGQPADIEIRMRQCNSHDFSTFAKQNSSHSDVSIFLTAQALAGDIHSVEFFVLAEENPVIVPEAAQTISPAHEVPELHISSDDLVPHGLIWQAIASQEVAVESHSDAQDSTSASPLPPSVNAIPRPAVWRQFAFKKWVARNSQFALESFRGVNSALMDWGRDLSAGDRRLFRAVALAIVVAVVILLSIPFTRKNTATTTPAMITAPSAIQAPDAAQPHAQNAATSGTSIGQHSGSIAQKTTPGRTSSAIRFQRNSTNSDGDYVARDTVTVFRPAHRSLAVKHQAGVQYFSDLEQ
jgi:hypothetical protein